MKALNIKGRLVDTKAYRQSFINISSNKALNIVIYLKKSILKGKWNDSDVLVKILILPRSLTVDSENDNVSSSKLSDFDIFEETTGAIFPPSARIPRRIRQN